MHFTPGRANDGKHPHMSGWTVGRKMCVCIYAVCFSFGLLTIALFWSRIYAYDKNPMRVGRMTWFVTRHLVWCAPVWLELVVSSVYIVFAHAGVTLFVGMFYAVLNVVYRLVSCTSFF